LEPTYREEDAMRRSVVPKNLVIVVLVLVFGVGITILINKKVGGSDSASQASPVTQTSVITPTVQSTDGSTPSVQAPPVPDYSKCNDLTIPAFTPDYSRGPLPGGGQTPDALWAKVTALQTASYDPLPDFKLGLANGVIPTQTGVICPNGDVYLQAGGSLPIMSNVTLVNSQPNGGSPAISGGHLWVHSAADAIGGVPCLAIIEIQDFPPLNAEQAIAAGLVGVTCTANGAFHVIPPQPAQTPQTTFTGRD
jgi:hypothetical protein